MNGQDFVKISTNLLEPRLPELGKVKIGGKGKLVRSRKGRVFRVPVKYDHFEVTTRAKDSEDQWILDERVHQVIGEKPTELDIRLLFDEPERNFQYFLAAYDGRTCRCKGNGETARDTEAGEIPCPCPLLAQFEGKYEGPSRPVGKVTCKPHGRLSVVLEAAESYGGFYVFRTTSWESIRNLSSQLTLFRAQFGYLAGLPLRLVLYPAQDTYEIKGEVKTSESYKVALVVRATFHEALKIAAAAHEQRSRLALPAGAEIAELHEKRLLAAEEAEAEEIAQEFHPETVAGVAEEALEEADYEVVDEEPEDQALQDLLVATLEIAGWKQIDINRQIAKYAGQLPELETILKKKLKAEYKKAQEDLEAKEDLEAAAEDDEPAEADEAVEEEDGELELF